jgi:hypothetical protein
VKDEIRTFLPAAHTYLDGDPVLVHATSIFAYIKAASLVMQDPPITTAQQSLEGHSNWAVNQPLSLIQQEARTQAHALRQLAVLG